MTQTNSSLHSLARGLGWFSIGLGVVELVAPGAIGRTLGMGRGSTLLRAYGARELAAGAGILTTDRDKLSPWLWGRVAGDALDLATLAINAARPSTGNTSNAIAIAAVAGVTALDVLCARALTEQQQRSAEYVDYSDRSGLPRPAEEMRGAAADALESGSPREAVRTRGVVLEELA